MILIHFFSSLFLWIDLKPFDVFNEPIFFTFLSVLIKSILLPYQTWNNNKKLLQKSFFCVGSFLSIIQTPSRLSVFNCHHWFRAKQGKSVNKSPRWKFNEIWDIINSTEKITPQQQVLKILKTIFLNCLQFTKWIPISNRFEITFWYYFRQNSSIGRKFEPTFFPIISTRENINSKRKHQKQIFHETQHKILSSLKIRAYCKWYLQFSVFLGKIPLLYRLVNVFWRAESKLATEFTVQNTMSLNHRFKTIVSKICTWVFHKVCACFSLRSTIFCTKCSKIPLN